MDITALELIYRNSETREEMDLALSIHNISVEELVNIAMEKGWESSPVTIKNIAAVMETDESASVSVDKNFIEGSNRAAVRRLHKICEHAVTKFQIEMSGMSTMAVVENLETLVKVREKLTKLEYPMYGLSTIEPPTPANPITVILSGGEEA